MKANNNLSKTKKAMINALLNTLKESDSALYKKIVNGDFSNEEILTLINTSVIPLGISKQGVFNVLIAHLSFNQYTKDTLQKFKNRLQSVVSYGITLTSTEKSYMRFVFINGFENKLPYTEYYRYLQNPIFPMDNIKYTRKILSFQTFNEIFKNAKKVYQTLAKNIATRNRL